MDNSTNTGGNTAVCVCVCVDDYSCIRMIVFECCSLVSHVLCKSCCPILVCQQFKSRSTTRFIYHFHQSTVIVAGRISEETGMRHYSHLLTKLWTINNGICQYSKHYFYIYHQMILIFILLISVAWYSLCHNYNMPVFQETKTSS